MQGESKEFPILKTCIVRKVVYLNVCDFSEMIIALIDFLMNKNYLSEFQHAVYDSKDTKYVFNFSTSFLQFWSVTYDSASVILPIKDLISGTGVAKIL